MFTTRSDGVCRRQTLAERAEGLKAPQRKIEFDIAGIEYYSHTQQIWPTNLDQRKILSS